MRMDLMSGDGTWEETAARARDIEAAVSSQVPPPDIRSIRIPGSS